MSERVPLRAKKGIKAPTDAVVGRLDSIRSHVEKAVDGAKMMRFDGPIEKCPVIPTGSLLLDRALGIGGYPQGRIVEVYGPESSGKTTLTLHAIANAQHACGGMAAFIDAEHALDVNYARALGVKVEELLISQPDYGEQALQTVSALVDNGIFGPGDIIVVDSVAALTPKAEIEGTIGDSLPGLHARLMSQTLRMLAGKIHRSGALLYFTNQIRHKIGVMFGSPETTSGGNALKFYASVRIDVRRIGSVKDEGNAVANKVRLKVAKNKMAPPFQEAETTIRFGEGISIFDELIDLGVEQGLIEKSGSWYSYQGERLAQGKENAIAAIRGNEEQARGLMESVRKAAFG